MAKGKGIAPIVPLQTQRDSQNDNTIRPEAYRDYFL